jgi:hypothetical protein
MGGRVVTVNDLLDGHVALDLQCLDRVYFNAYIPKLQTSAGPGPVGSWTRTASAGQRSRD